MVSRECRGLNTPVSAAQSPWLTSVRLCRSGYYSGANVTFESFVAGVYLERGDGRRHRQWERNKMYQSK